MNRVYIIHDAYVDSERAMVIVELDEEFTVKEFHEGGETDEGYSATETKYELEDGVVTRHVFNHSRDCDGPLEQHYIHEATVQDLNKAFFEAPLYRKQWDGDETGYIIFPQFGVWQKVESWQRDIYAERMGY